MLRRRTATMVLDLMRGAARLLRSVPRRLRGRESVFTRIYTTNEWGNGDFNYDGRVDDSDVTLLGAFYDESATPVSAAELTQRYGAEFAAAFEAGQKPGTLPRLKESWPEQD